jgi:hypothetical protein
MSQNLNAGYTEAQVRKIFFLGEAQAQDQNHQSSVPLASATGAMTARRPGFLSALSGQAYDRVCQHIIKNPSLRFPDINRFLRLKRDDTRIMAQVLAHVVGWLNTEPTDVAWQQESTKPHQAAASQGYGADSRRICANIHPKYWLGRSRWRRRY